MNIETLKFVADHAADDVRQLALEGARHPLVDMPWALDQIRGRQVAMRKLPLLARIDGIRYPVHLSMEQCSSQMAAHYKLRLVRRLLAPAHRGRMTDLTGGFGIDFLALSLAFGEATYVERNEALCHLMAHNLGVLKRSARVLCAEAEEALDGLAPQSLIYIDPARRDHAGARTYAIADCTPNVAALMPRLTSLARVVMIKLSPMLDWHEAVRLLGCVSEVHIVAVGGECKELLLVCSAQASGAPAVYGADDRRQWRLDDPTATIRYAQGTICKGDYLYEPNAAVMKSGCFAPLCLHYGVEMLAPDSHLMLSAKATDGFPGRCFQVKAVSTLNRKEVRRTLQGIERANVAVRHFPMSAPELRRRLGLKDGGSLYIFGTTLSAGHHVLIVCEKK